MAKRRRTIKKDPEPEDLRTMLTKLVGDRKHWIVMAQTHYPAIRDDLYSFGQKYVTREIGPESPVFILHFTEEEITIACFPKQHISLAQMMELYEDAPTRNHAGILTEPDNTMDIHVMAAERESFDAMRFFLQIMTGN